MKLLVKQNSQGGIVVGNDKNLLGKTNDIVIDGFQYGACLRVQTHFHTDHTVGFSNSKKEHDIIMTEPTRQLLATDSNSLDILERPGIKGINTNEEYLALNKLKVQLVNNAHVLGSCQVKISNDSYSIGYSGDFYKPEKVISVDHLIIDGSVAGIFRQRKFSREESIEALRSLISNNIGRVPIIIKAHSGLLEKIYYWISDVLRNIPRICDDKFYRSLEIHSEFGSGQINNIYKRGDSAGIEILKSNNYIRFLRQKEDSYGLEDKFIINCNRFSDNDDNPCKETSNGYSISLTDHADINLTIDYIKRVNPSYVSVDRVRIGNSAKAKELMNYIKGELDVEIVDLELLEDERF